ncbi:hypothetical protein CPB84DRAFT_1782954 [Gymnopilus junonius]|uniref:F-box domain-containing protein n=1 Tax=Gymnopilus junonius TaxID=109634 RepID=A0A9P5NKT6_GYMJU|nr:hypothetical protein CPB84DRAFT_1782954 [Gymnopilus junonius]
MDPESSRVFSPDSTLQTAISALHLSPISNLPPYILNLIFLTNTVEKLNYPSRLTTAIQTSQVCHAWRETALDSPLLWGRLIDFDHRSLKLEWWRTELIRRSGNAPLWVQGHVRTHEDSEYFSYVLNNHWERIQVLDIEAQNDFLPPSLTEAQLWAVLHHPAPILQTFKVGWTLSANPSEALFADQAPQLEVIMAPGIPFNLRAPWISHIQDIDIGADFTLSELLGALDYMRNVKFLSFDCPYELDPFHNILPIVFPFLEMLQINGSLTSGLSILQSIIPGSPSCSFILFPNPREPDLDDDFVSTMLEAICEQILKFMQFLPLTSRLFLQVGHDPQYPSTFQLSLHDAKSQEYLNIDLWDYPTISRHLLSRLASSNPSLLSNVKVMRLRLAKNVSATQILPVLDLFLASLPSITTLETSDSDNVLAFLHDSEASRPLPGLHTLSFYELLRLRNWTEREERLNEWRQQYPSGVLLPFLQQRKAIGLPITVVDITYELLNLERSDMELFEQVSGLVVRYRDPTDKKIVDYKCGSGQIPF